MLGCRVHKERGLTLVAGIKPQPNRIPFVKYTLHGNKFVIVDEVEGSVLSEVEKMRFAHRATDIYYGVGSDNFIVIQSCKPEVLEEINQVHHYWEKVPDSNTSNYIFRMFEPDGKEAFSCGNGLLCVSNYLKRQYGIDSARIMTEIPTSRPKVLTIGTNKIEHMNWSNMGIPGKIPPGMIELKVPISQNGRLETINNLKIVLPAGKLKDVTSDTALMISGYLVFTGEPHFVVFMDTGFSSKELADHLFNSSPFDRTKGSNAPDNEDLNSLLVNHIGMAVNFGFSNGTPAGLNITFARIHENPKALEYRCFEWGINRETWACGTGAVAAAFVARYLNKIDSNQILVWPYLGRLRDSGARLGVAIIEDDYILHGNPILLFEGTFFASN